MHALLTDITKFELFSANKTKGEIPKQCRYPKRQKVFFQRPMKKEVLRAGLSYLGKKNRGGPLKDNCRELWLSALKSRLFWNKFSFATVVPWSKIIQKLSEGKQKKKKKTLLRVSGRDMDRTIYGKITVHIMYKGNPGDIDFGSS